VTFPLTCRCLLLSLIICSPTATPRQKSSSTATETADSTSRPVWPQWCNHERELWTGRCDRQKWGSDKLPPPTQQNPSLDMTKIPKVRFPTNTTQRTVRTQRITQLTQRWKRSLRTLRLLRWTDTTLLAPTNPRLVKTFNDEKYYKSPRSIIDATIS